MVFSDQTYSVLVVSAAQKFNEAFAAMLPGSEYYPVRFVGNIAALLLNQSLKWLVSARERLRRMEEKATSVEEKMEEIRLVNRAKWLLIEQLKMTEAEAHRHIEKQAMDRCTTRREIALGIIKTYA